MSNAVLYCTPSYKHWCPQAATRSLASNTSQNKTTQQRLRRRGHLLCWVESSSITHRRMLHHQPRRTNTTKINQAVHKVTTQLLRQKKASSQPLSTNTSARTRLAVSNAVLYCIDTILQALVSPSCNTRAGKQQNPEQADTTRAKSSALTLVSVLASRVSSHGALGVALLHAQLAAVLCRIKPPCPTTRVSPFAVVSSGKMPGWPQGACTAPHPTNGAIQHGQLLCWVE